MRSVIFQACTLALSLGVLTQSHQAAAASLLLPIRVLGFDPTEYSQLAGPTFACADGSRLIPLARVNDDNCDCADGSDERGTAACAHLSSAPAFVCLNPGYLSERIPTSRVADGICDCCDGADERDAPTKCPNTCASRRASAEAAVAERLSGLRAGVSARTSLVAEATATRAAAAARVETLEAELVAADARTADLQSALTAEEAKEKEANDVARAAFAAEQEQRRAALEAAAAPVVAEVESVQQLLKDIEREAAPVAEEEEQEDDGIDLDAMLEEAMRNNGIIPASDEADANADAAVAKETAAAAAGTAATNEGEGDGEIFFPYPKEYQPGYEAKKAVAEAEAAAAAAAEAEAEETEAEASAAPAAAAAAAHTETFTPIETPGTCFFYSFSPHRIAALASAAVRPFLLSFDSIAGARLRVRARVLCSAVSLTALDSVLHPQHPHPRTHARTYVHTHKHTRTHARTHTHLFASLPLAPYSRRWTLRCLCTSVPLCRGVAVRSLAARARRRSSPVGPAGRAVVPAPVAGALLGVAPIGRLRGRQQAL
jgi:protein kinase C substrate 80K-H